MEGGNTGCKNSEIKPLVLPLPSVQLSSLITKMELMFLPLHKTSSQRGYEGCLGTSVPRHHVFLENDQ